MKLVSRIFADHRNIMDDGNEVVFLHQAKVILRLAGFHFGSRRAASVLNAFRCPSKTPLCNTSTADIHDITIAERKRSYSKQLTASSMNALVCGSVIFCVSVRKSPATLST